MKFSDEASCMLQVVSDSCYWISCNKMYTLSLTIIKLIKRIVFVIKLHSKLDIINADLPVGLYTADKNVSAKTISPVVL